MFLLDTNNKTIIKSVYSIFALSKSVLENSVYVRYIHVTDIDYKANSSNSHSSSHRHLNVSNIDDLVQASGAEQIRATTQFEGLTTKSAFFVISDTSAVQDLITYVRHNQSF